VSWPVVDILTDRAAVLLQDRPVVGLTQGLLDAFLAADHHELDIQLVTPATSRLTLPLRMALSGDSRWVVHTSGREYLDGGHGGRLHWQDGAFVPADPAGAGAPPGLPGPIDHRPAVESGRQLWLNVELRHEQPPAALGLGVEAVCRALTGRPPAGWGTAEPVSRRWRPSELSQVAAGRAPQPTFVVLVGDGDRPVIGTLEISTDASVIAESATLAIGYPADEEPPLTELPGLVETLGIGQSLALFFAMVRLGRRDLTFPPAARVRQAMPVGLAVGPAARDGVSTTEALALPGARLVGPPEWETIWYDLPVGWRSLTAIARTLHADIPLPQW
jgi:hypothetical protein